MLQVDLGQLDRKRRLTIDVAVPPEHPLWEGVPWSLHGPLRVRLEAQRVGADVVVRGRLQGEAEELCRRCLKPVRVALDEEVTFLFRSGLEEREAEEQDAYAMAAKALLVDLERPVREHVVLAVPQFVVCEEECRGFCPRCGADLNEGACSCAAENVDERWAVLRRLTQP
jgi:uncharacterized protein